MEKKRDAAGLKAVSRVVGIFETLAGLALAAYIVAWMVGYVRWSADIAFALMGAMALFFVIDGLSRVIRGKSALAVKSKLVNLITQFSLFIIVGIMIFVQVLIFNGSTVKSNEKVDYVIVFGAKIYGNTPSPLLQGRIYEAAVYMKDENPDAIAIACGGKTEGSDYSEAQVIRDVMVSWGIDESRILIEDNSTGSKQNVQNAISIINERGGGSVMAVTSDYHLYRCMRLLENRGMETYGRGSELALYIRPIAHFREMVSVMFDFVRDLFVS